jgi:hypothetical protein
MVETGRSSTVRALPRAGGRSPASGRISQPYAGNSHSSPTIRASSPARRGRRHHLVRISGRPHSAAPVGRLRHLDARPPDAVARRRRCTLVQISVRPTTPCRRGRGRISAYLLVARPPSAAGPGPEGRIRPSDGRAEPSTGARTGTGRWSQPPVPVQGGWAERHGPAEQPCHQHLRAFTHGASSNWGKPGSRSFRWLRVGAIGRTGSRSPRCHGLRSGTAG